MDRQDSVGCLVLCHTRELAYQICNEFERFSRYLPDIKTKVPLGWCFAICAARHAFTELSVHRCFTAASPSLSTSVF